ncbi:MAG: type I restriction enzyme HsdR N-terminal domain-containing protein [Cytophagales bacterium]|nr:type I restriction enzyme HsdR N-terminal domain-containing protein [Bernardetiaceae bacterium]MDW8203742.1 type I restriction enzyme HsdR N-terminal domain-containing protein [Cytophagales bacterium]
MQVLNLPSAPLRLTNLRGQALVFDICRRRWVKLTPEEWVRQHWLHYLIGDLGFSKSLIKVEQTVGKGTSMFRADVVAYRDASLTPYLILECKAAHVPLGESELQQLLHYQHYIAAHALAISNGLDHIFFEKNSEGVMQPVAKLSIMENK